MNYCPHCGKEVSPDQRFCSNCGKDISNSNNNPNLKPCPVCKKEIGTNAKLCPHCGSRIKPSIFKVLIVLIKNRMTWVVILFLFFQNVFYSIFPSDGLRRWSNNQFSDESYIVSIIIILIGFLIPFALIPAKKEILTWGRMVKSKKVVIVSMVIFCVLQLSLIPLNISDQNRYFREMQTKVNEYITTHMIQVDNDWYATSKENDSVTRYEYLYKFVGDYKISIYAPTNFNWLNALDGSKGNGSIEIKFSEPILQSPSSSVYAANWRTFKIGEYYFEFLSYDVKFKNNQWELVPSAWSDLDPLYIDTNLVRGINERAMKNKDFFDRLNK